MANGPGPSPLAVTLLRQVPAGPVVAVPYGGLGPGGGGNHHEARTSHPRDPAPRPTEVEARGISAPAYLLNSSV